MKGIQVKYIASFIDGTTTYVIAIDQDGFIHLESRWVDDEGTVKGDEIVFGEGAGYHLVTGLKAALSAL